MPAALPVHCPADNACLLICGGLQVPLILTTSFPDAVAKPLETALASIKRKKYKVVLSSDLVHPGDELSREESALVGYYLALDADKFSGNSVSTLTAMLILERQWLNRCMGGGQAAALAMLLLGEACFCSASGGACCIMFKAGRCFGSLPAGSRRTTTAGAYRWTHFCHFICK